MGHRVAVVQNGIIENYRELREELTARGCVFRSETDTEVIPHLIAENLQGGDLLAAVQKTITHLEGAFAIAVISGETPDELIVARQQAPLILGFGQGEFFCASDITALIPHTRAVLALENGEIARLTPLGVELYNFQGDRLKRTPRTLEWNPVLVEKQGFRHYMLKEIHEQPAVVRTNLEVYLHPQWRAADQPSYSPINLGIAQELLESIERVEIVACGTSWHASLIGQYLLEQIAGIPTAVHYASEFRYAPPPLLPHTLTIGVTQSGETADTLAALEMEQARRLERGQAYRAHLLGITNRPESTITQLVDDVILSHADIEIGVAATKTFVAQLMAFYFLAIDLAFRRQSQPLPVLEELIAGLRQIPVHIEKILQEQEKAIEEMAHQLQEARDFVFIGRGINFPIALEGALKLKEISYIHAEGYPAGEMKHGPIALLDAKVPVVAIAMPGGVYDKVISNVQEAKARDAQMLGVVAEGDRHQESFDRIMTVPAVPELLSPLVAVIPLQLLSYHIAARRGLDVDQPRNLAKSVTVE
jgi:glucosamine--fructose-6-phosphate aminotransferase (isomerizing)